MRRFAAALIAAVLLCACESKDVRTLFVGTYSDGFYTFDFDVNAGDILPAEGEYGSVAKAAMPNPSFLSISGNHVYAVSEMPDSSASVWAWRYGGGGFDLLNRQPSCGADPCYVAASKKEWLAVANYSGGNLAVYRLLPNGHIAPVDTLINSSVGGPDLSRQESPHVHCAQFVHEGKQLLFSEFSADAIGLADITSAGLRNYRLAAQLPPDFGPRHLLERDGRLYVIGELSGDIAVYDFYENGRTQLRQIVKADAVGARGAADLHFSPDGRYLYASLRLQNDGIAIFRADDQLVPAGYQTTGPHPRNFTVLDNWLLVACRDSNQIEIYARDPLTGALTDTGRRISVSKPVFVQVQ